MKDVRLAFLGCGNAARMHSKTLAGRPVTRLYASRGRERAEEYNKRFGGQGAFGSYADAIASPDVDGVVITTPPDTHLELTLEALRAGKHVIVEKPPLLRAADFAAVAGAARQAERQVCVAENYFYKPLLIRLREVLAQGDIGQPLFVVLNALKRQTTDDWRDDTSLVGGGALFEGGIHWVSFAASLGLPELNVRGWRPAPDDRLERSMMLALDYDSGPVGALYYSWEVPSLLKGLRLSRIWGREGSITFESNGLFVIVRGRRKRILFPGLRDIAGYGAMFDDFLRSIRDNVPPEYDLQLAERDLRLVEQAYTTAGIDLPGDAEKTT
jgi:UDP-N-acetylglucosamine 3-dehydrogenase